VRRVVEDLVVDVGDVADEGDLQPLLLQPAAQDVERDGAAQVPTCGAAWTVGPQT
jgi:hypothetical protein